MANALQKQTDLSIPELQAKLDVVLKLQDKFELLKNDYYGIANDTEYAEAEPSLNSLEDDLQDFEVRLKTSINKFKYEAESSSMLNNSQPKGSQIKLPKIPLPTFTGKLEEWGLFKTQFCDLVIENSQLSDSKKLHYLRGALRGDASS
ncbi:uncharacterized protein TNCT_685741 [Trichonephila clavata]|uniref:Uncharacterized protein n=1 Tax=Trichonephila clavata TaxID=2740835 RepID=A0A8X6J823_TRICU|nr:uncharacterized protein TNCT_685741 [Trichonephila clavata]